MDGERLLSELRDALEYDPETGIFRWKRKVARKIVPGMVAGASEPRGYIIIGYTDSEGVKHQIRAHQLAVWFATGVFPPEVDHSDRDKANTKLSNLRSVTTSVNKANIGLISTNTSGKRGVTWVASRKKWQAQIDIDDRCKFLGRFDHIEDAIAARRAAELEHFGEYCPS